MNAKTAVKKFPPKAKPSQTDKRSSTKNITCNNYLKIEG